MYKISFFSYKGGSGRSSALVNTIPFLAKKLEANSDHPIVLMDMDMDSTGLTYLLHQGNSIAGHLTVQQTMVEGVPGSTDHSPDLQEHAFFSKLLKVGGEFGMEEGAVLLLPAAAGETVGEDGSNRNISGGRDSGHLKRIESLCTSYRCTALVYDSSAGDQDTATLSNSKADVIVCCMRPTIQFQEGTLDYFRRMNRIVHNKEVILMPNAVSRAKVNVDGEMYPISAKNRIIEAFEKAFPDTGNTIRLDAFFDGKFGIPLVQRFLWQETILKNLDPSALTEDEKEALDMYDYTASLIVKYGKTE